MTTPCPTDRPFLKWLGGKSRIKKLVIASFPHAVKSFHDVFLGGGAVLIHLLHRMAEGAVRVEGVVRACDVNTALIGVFRNLRDHPHELLAACDALQSRYRTASSIDEKKTIYADARAHYNTIEDRSTVDSSAHFVFLNKAGFRGMYRENKRGEFNVPFGNYERITLLEREHALRLSELFQPVVFECESFEQSLQQVAEGDAAYLDPPYVPVRNNSFTSYNANGFSEREHRALFDTVDALRDMGAHIVLSNAATAHVFERFVAKRYFVRRIESPRHIHVTNPQSTATEVLVASVRPLRRA